MPRMFSGNSFAHCLSLVVMFYCSLAHGQITSIDDSTSTPIPGVGHDYINLLSETVDPASGDASLRIQLPTPTGRGISLPFSISYDSNAGEHLTGSPFNNGAVYWTSNGSELGQGGWNYSLPSITFTNWNTTLNGSVDCYYSSNYVFTDPTGGRHALGIGTVTQVSPETQCTTYTGGEYPTGGDLQYTAKLYDPCAASGTCNYGLSPVVVSDIAGTTYTFPPNGVVLPYLIEDRNGNQLTINDPGNGNFSVTDTLDRTLISSTGFGVSGQSYNVSISGQTYKVAWTSNSASLPTPQSHLVAGPVDCAFSPTGGSGQPVISSITLPNNKKYQFLYDSTYGLLKEIVYPSGGWVKYTWKLSDTLSDLVGFPGPTSGYCYYQYAKPVVATRQVSFTGSGVSLSQAFTYSTTWSTTGEYQGFWWQKKTTTVKATDPVFGTNQTIYSYGYTSANLPPYQLETSTSIPGQIALEQQIQYYDWGNNASPKMTVTKGWGSPFNIECEFQTIGSQTSGSFYQYSYGQMSDHKEFDFGQLAASSCYTGAAVPTSPTPRRETVSTFQSFTGPPYVSEGLVFGRPTSTIIYGNGTSAAETDYVYDGASLSSVTAFQHDDSYYGTSFTTRGNVTTKTQKCIGCTNAVTTYTYDVTGQLLSATDPCGNGTCSDMSGSAHTTNYSYTDAYTELSGGANSGYTPPHTTNAYLTIITDPLSHTETFTYDYNNGQLTSSTDPNSNSTAYLYNDLLNRPTLTTYPNGGQTQYAYNDSAYNSSYTSPTPSITTTTSIASSINKVSTVAFDGLGHTVEGLLSSDPDGATYSITSYHGTGAPYIVYNPTRCSPPTTNCTTEPTWGYSTYSYDALNRITSLTEQDTSVVSTTYTNNCVKTTDEAGNARQTCSDGLGRITSVTEDPSNLDYVTTYTYDALNDVQSVTENGGRVRTFVYDSLARLTSATNPESGTITYQYDNNSNLSSKTAPSPNQPTGGIRQ